MPDRYLREGLLRSERWNALTLDARDLYVRLVLVVDDYGCFDARPFVIAHEAYFFGRTEPLPLEALHQADLILRYTNGGRPYLAITQWGEGYRGRRRHPAPPVFNDRPGVQYRGVYGKVMNWANPIGTEVRSTLVDINGAPVVPQPPEWRRVDSDWMPIALPPQAARVTAVVTSEVTAPVTTRVTKPVTEAKRSDYASDLPSHGMPSPVSRHPSPSLVVVDAAAEQPASPVTAPVTAAPTATPTNGKVQLQDNGAWAGVSDEQVARWQEMFSEMSVPDQIERAGAWLVAHADQRALYTQRGELEEYLIRWLLNEARQAADRTARAKATVESQGKR